MLLYSRSLTTPLGPMLAIGDEKALYLLEFNERKNLNRNIQQLKIASGATITPGRPPPLQSIEKELDLFFNNKLMKFNTPYSLVGSPFRLSVWQALQTIPFGSTQSYLGIAQILNRPTASRAVGEAVGANKLAIIVPCHRVIGARGHLVGYAAGIPRKDWLLSHEKKGLKMQA